MWDNGGNTMNQHIYTWHTLGIGRRTALLFLLCGMILLTPGMTLAVPIVGARIIVATDGNVIVTYRGHTGSYSNDLYLDSPAGAFPGIIFNNRASTVGSMVDLGTFTAGMELVFRLHVNDTEVDFFTGDALRNPDGKPHARVDDAFSPTETLVEFEDLFGTPEFPGGFNDLGFFFTNVRATATGVCDIQLNQTSFVNGDQVIAQVARLANPDSTPVPVEVKLWFEVPGSPAVPFLTVGADGRSVLPPGFDQDFGPLSLATVPASVPRGQYQFNCRLLHAVTGAPLAEDFNPFQLQ
jgi:hypothetical protein